MARNKRSRNESTFMRMPYNVAMNRYGSDKPDIRFQMEIQDLTDLFINTEFNVFKKIFEFNGTIRGINFKGELSIQESKLMKS